MTEAPPRARPSRILLATDLSCRCDRALDRAAMLAREWQADLLVVHVMEAEAENMLDAREGWSRFERRDAVKVMRRRVEADLAELANDLPLIDVVVATGDPADRIIEIAEQEGCGLIVTGIARDEQLGRMFVGTTVNRLIRKSRVPVLVVHSRARRSYRTILVATDFSETSRQALVTSVGLFPDAGITLVHGLDVPRAPFDYTDAGDACRAMERDQRAQFLQATAIDPSVRDTIGLSIRRGDPEQVVADYAIENGADLTVIGSHGRSALFDVVIGSTTKRLLEQLQGDMLIVVDPRRGRKDRNEPPSCRFQPDGSR